MKPVKDLDYKLVDILNAILDTGVLINADVIVTVSGIPLLGINLRAALGGMATMLDYGLMEAWDKDIRKYYSNDITDMELPMDNNEKIVLSTLGSYYCSQGIDKTRRYGIICLTNKRLVILRINTREILFETQIKNISALMYRNDPVKKERGKAYIRLENGEIILQLDNLKEFKDKLETNMAENKIVFQHNFPVSLPSSNEKIIQNVWFLSPQTDIIGETWMPGCMHITNERMYWTHKLDDKILFDVSLKHIIAFDAGKTKSHFAYRIQPKNKVFRILYKDSDSEAAASFSMEEINKIKDVIEDANKFIYSFFNF